MEASQAAQPEPRTQYGRTFECGAHFFQGILHYDDTRWLTYLSLAEYKRYDAGDLKCIKLRPERGEIPRRFGDYLVYANRKFYRDPVVNWTDQPPPKSLKFYLADPKFRRYVRQESEMDTNVRARFERMEDETDTRAKAVEMVDIPEDKWPLVLELLPRKSLEQIAAQLSTPALIITYGAVDRLKRQWILDGTWQEPEVPLQHRIAADEATRERQLALSQHLLEQSTDHVVRHSPHEGAELRRNANLHAELAKFAQKRIDSNTLRLEARKPAQEADASGPSAAPPNSLQKKLSDLEAKVARLEQALAAMQGQAEAAAEPPASAGQKQAPAAPPSPARGSSESQTASFDGLQGAMELDPTEVASPEATDSPPSPDLH